MTRPVGIEANAVVGGREAMTVEREAGKEGAANATAVGAKVAAKAATKEAGNQGRSTAGSGASRSSKTHGRRSKGT